MLLMIVMSNTAFHLWAARHGPTGWHPVDGSTADRIVQFAMIVGLDGRAYPVFAFLFGYGMMQLFRRQVAAGATPRAATALLRRRSLWLLLIGFGHAALLLAGDIIGFYAVVSLLLGWLFLRRSGRTLLVAAAVSVLLRLLVAAPALSALLSGDLAAAGTPVTEPSALAFAAGEDNPLVAAGTRLTTWAIITGYGAVGWLLATELLLGFWAARRRVLEDPAAHRRLLRWTALLGVPVGWLGGLPLALAHVGWLDVPPAALGTDGALSSLAQLTGVPGGLGYVALFGLLAARVPVRRSRAAVGGDGRPDGVAGDPRQPHAAAVDGLDRRPGAASDGPNRQSGTAGGPEPRRAAAALAAVVAAIAAVGKRSLSCYLGHSLLFAPVLAAWGLGLGGRLGSATMAAFALGVWLLTVVGANLLERYDHPGPAEALLRRLVYGPRTTAGARHADGAPAPAQRTAGTASGCADGVTGAGSSSTPPR
jgi:uncharacterized membrane protein YeiB